ncbi:unnamed protein product [Meloidogyne enterolobii]|uniref:Uncharacterized protein n=1 Tax=Meloidogyne enterolobii TaxID=390850 RepID=A0ACB0ZK33_MELEN
MIKVEYFTEDKNLFDIFNQIAKGKQAISINQSFVDVGIYANEIGKRFEFLESLKKNYIKVFEIYFVNFKKFKRMENYWENIKEKLISKNEDEINRKVENDLYYFLIKLLKVIDGRLLLNIETSGKIKENLYLEKISKYFVEHIKVNWSVLTANQRQFVQEIFKLKEKEILDELAFKIEKRIKELKQINEQLDIGLCFRETA